MENQLIYNKICNIQTSPHNFDPARLLSIRLLHSLNRSMWVVIFPQKARTTVCLGFYINPSSMSPPLISWTFMFTPVQSPCSYSPNVDVWDRKKGLIYSIRVFGFDSNPPNCSILKHKTVEDPQLCTVGTIRGKTLLQDLRSLSTKIIYFMVAQSACKVSYWQILILDIGLASALCPGMLACHYSHCW